MTPRRLSRAIGVRRVEIWRWIRLHGLPHGHYVFHSKTKVNIDLGVLREWAKSAACLTPDQRERIESCITVEATP